MFNLEDYISAPTQEALLLITRDELLRVAGHYKVEVRGGISKADLQEKLIGELYDRGLFGEAAKVVPDPPSTPDAGKPISDLPPPVGKAALEWKRLELREKEIEWEREKVKLEAERQTVREREQREHELRLKDLEFAQALRVKELDIKARESGVFLKSDQFDVTRNTRVLPPFREDEVDKFFAHFERVATTLRWPREVWTMTLQCVFTGKAQEAYSSLTLEDAADYDKVKQAVLRVYSLVPEAYRQKFRAYQKPDGLTYVEFVREKELLFDRWLNSQKVSTFQGLRDLVILEDFLNCLPQLVATHVGEHKDLTPARAAVLADEYVLNHKRVHPASVKSPPRHTSPPKSSKTFKEFLPVAVRSPDKRTSPPRGVPTCAYCQKRGHVLAECYLRKRRNKTPHHPASSNACVSTMPLLQNADGGGHTFAPFILDGYVSLPGQPSVRVPIKILRDTGASQSFILQDVLPFSDESFTGNSVLVRGFEMGFVNVPLHTISLFTDLVAGDVTVGVRPSLPVENISMLLGNDIAGGRVLPGPIVCDVSPASCSDDLAAQFPDVFSANVVTRAMARKERDAQLQETQDFTDLSDTFMVQSPLATDTSVSSCSVPLLPLNKLSLSRERLIQEQKSDPSLKPLFSEVLSDEDIENSPQGYFIRDGVLMRKWRPLTASAQDEWRVLFQIVVPASCRDEILSLAHDHHFAGHLGVNKTVDRILRYFFWPGIKKDVVHYCRTCHVCQITGKPNQVVPPAPLQPIPVASEPFENVILDCVGPLPRTKSGNQYLLTIMCSFSRFPEALFGLPKSVQTDRGTNFTSRVFAQAMRQLAVKHVTSSSYHPQSQGALERFHQTLKTMLKSFCLEFERDWDEGVLLALFAVREVVQESLGFSPSELVFGHTVRGPLRLLQESWLTETNACLSLTEYVLKMRTRLTRACELAKQSLGLCQNRMKQRYDKKAVSRTFKPNDKVMVLIPVMGSALQARFCGPYLVQKRVTDLNYVISTPDRRKRTRLCHVNQLKPYYERVSCDKRKPPCSPAVVTDGDASEVKAELSTTVGAEVVSLVTAAHSDSDGRVPTVEVIEGRMRNSEVLNNLDSFLSHLPQPQRKELAALITVHDDLFPDVPRRTTVICHDIDVGDASPIKQHFYRVNPYKRLIFQKEVKFMLENGIAEPSCSPWSSPCLLVPKSDGSARFCTDFRRVNALTKPDCYPLPRVDDCVDRLGSAVYVSKIDLLKGYWQVPLADRAKEISAFVTPDHFLQYTCMAFGLRNAPATFQRLINGVLEGVANCEAYLDDLILHSTTWPEHLALLTTVFQRLSAANLSINLAKCEFGQATVVYLGKVVGGGQVRPVQSKVEAILNYPVPSTRRELRRFLGMVGYYRSFCKNFAAIAAPLTDLLSSKVSFAWTQRSQVAFESVKALLTTAPVLAAPNFSLPFSLAVDASDLGAGAVLLQSDQHGLEHPVCFYSRKFDKHQRAYSTIEKEALALVLALQHIEVYVGGAIHPVVVYTDHNPLVFLTRMRNCNQRLMCWSVILQGYNLEIKHIRGRDNVVADALSRV
ncbi:hypothetical protein ACEWY4_000014 [Coilia grayii]|uniref:Gypsy retrotransposon integrase-like protein 1 n=1 Tax=Coilia grayii TaxID=363190 RepID=A0ABD1KVW6_9TELE